VFFLGRGMSRDRVGIDDTKTRKPGRKTLSSGKHPHSSKTGLEWTIRRRWAGLVCRAPRPGDSAAIYFFVALPSSAVFQVVPSGDISNLKL
jgi:hypothetical protein